MYLKQTENQLRIWSWFLIQSKHHSQQDKKGETMLIVRKKKKTYEE